MKKKRFYDDKKRGRKWTENETGRKIEFADKYDESQNGENKWNASSATKRKIKKPTKAAVKNFFKRFGVVICCILIVGVGYVIMDVHMDRHAMPSNYLLEKPESKLNAMKVDAKSTVIDNRALDGAVMLDAVIKDVSTKGYSSVTFDLKRSDGTVGYNSSLATIETIGAISAASSDLKKSDEKLSQNDILPIGMIACYRDNVLPISDSSAAVIHNSKIYKDKDGYTYLNPSSETTYNYIKGIVEDASGMGVNVFILTDYNLPKEVSENYNDGFKYICDKLVSEVDSDIKILKGVDVNISSTDKDDIKNEISDEMKKKTNNNEIYCVKCKKSAMDKVKDCLDSSGYTGYVISA